MITLTTSTGYPFQIDDDDLELVKTFPWYRHKHRNTYYLITISEETIRKSSATEPKLVVARSMYLHRLLTGAPKGMIVHHKDGNGWNNCRSNLEVMTQMDHMATDRHMVERK